MDGENAYKVLLQQRAETEIVGFIEKPQSYPGICQPTWNGGVEKNENLIEAVKREGIEELGTKFMRSFNTERLVMFNVIEYTTYKGEKVTGYNFVGTVFEEKLKLVELHFGAMPNFIAVGVEELPMVIFIESDDKNDKSSNYRATQPEIVLFKDQYKVLQEALFFLKRMLDCLR